MDGRTRILNFPFPNLRNISLITHSQGVGDLKMITSDIMISGGRGNVIRVWNLNITYSANPANGVIIDINNMEPIKQFEIQNQNLLIVASTISVKIWHIYQRTILKSRQLTNISCLKVISLYNEHILATCFNDQILILKTSDLTTIANLNCDNYIRNLEYIKNYDILIALTDKGFAVLWNLTSFQVLNKQKIHNQNALCIKSINSSLLVTGGQDNLIKTWRLNLDNNFRLELLQQSSQMSAIRVLAVYNNGMNIASGNDDGLFQIYESYSLIKSFSLEYNSAIVALDVFKECKIF